MGELYNPFPKLPKNIRQIGEKDEVVKLYLEDYVNTYLKRLYPTGGQDLRVGLLLGSMEQHDGTPYLFIDGAMEMEDVTAEGEKVIFTEAAWKKAYQNMEEAFPKRTVQGWFLCGMPGCTLSPLNYWKQHSQYFTGKNQLMYLNCGLEGEESIYVTSEDGFYRLKGHNIYYERNQMMQDYMILRKDAKRVEAGVTDSVTRDFRRKLESRKIEATGRRNTIHTLGAVCSALAVVCLAGGIVMFNNYQKMKEMESVLVSVIPQGSKNWKGGSNEEDHGVLIEQMPGNVYPTEAGQTAGGGIPMEGSAGQASLLDDAGQGSGQYANGGQDVGQAGSYSGAEAMGTLASKTQDAGRQNQAAGQQGQAEGQQGQAAGQQNQAGQQYTKGGQGAGQEAGSPAPGQDGGQASGGGAASSAAGQEGSEVRNPDYPTQGGNATASQSYDETVASFQSGDTYIVSDGETLFGICLKVYHNLSRLDEICELNQIEDVDKIISGQKLILP